MKILLVGYGKMGKAIEAIALERGHEVVGKIGSKNAEDIHLFNASNTDVCIEFSLPELAFSHIQTLLKAGVPTLSGTTGWLQHLPKVEQLCHEQKGTFFYASNYSIGVNLFFKVNQFLAQRMKLYPEYQVHLEEIHHTQKKDAPSGTAITLAQDIISELPDYEMWVNRETNNPKELPIISLRTDEVPGTHYVRYQSAIDTIEISHTAHSRTGFAQGAVLVAEWLPAQKGMRTMNDFLPL